MPCPLHNRQQVDPGSAHRRHGHRPELMEVNITEPGIMTGTGKRSATALSCLTIAVQYQASHRAYG
jgi:hypothetical protein